MSLNMIRPDFDLDKIKYGVDTPTFLKAIDLYRKGKVINFEEGFGSFSASVNRINVWLGRTAYKNGKRLNHIYGPFCG